MEKIRARSLLAVPILFNQEMLGFIAVEGQNPRIWQENEKQFLEVLINAIKFFATLNNDRVKLVQFKDTAKGGFYVLDFKKLDRLFDKNLVDLSAAYSAEGATPKVTIFNKIDGSPVLSVRMYKSGSGYIRNYIEKEKGLVKLLRVRGS
jgi:hypothetical protein